MTLLRKALAGACTLTMSLTCHGQDLPASAPKSEREAASASQPTWGELKQHVLTIVAPAEYRSVAPCQPLGQLAAQCFVLDHHGTRTTITTKEMDAWGISLPELQATAATNLLTISPTDRFRLNLDGEEINLVISSRHDGYDAARILLPEVQRFIRKALQGDALVAIPHRDFLIAWRLDNPRKRILAGRVVQDFHQQPNPLTYELFVLDHKGLHAATAQEALGED